MDDISMLMEDPDFAFPYKIRRTRCGWNEGEFVPLEQETLNFYGPVQPATVEELEQMPEGDRQKGIMKFFCKSPKTIHVTNEAPEFTGISDVVVWHGEAYKIIQVMPWNHYGWLKAFGYKQGVDEHAHTGAAGEVIP